MSGHYMSAGQALRNDYLFRRYLERRRNPPLWRRIINWFL
jgi:hypothetical protein